VALGGSRTGHVRGWPRLAIRGSDTLTVAGVVDQPRLYSVREDDRAQVFLPATPGIRTDTRFVLALEEGVSPEALAEPVRRSAVDRDPDLSLSDVASSRERVRRSLVPERLNLRLALLFALAAVLLAGLGLYGVVSGMVLRRRREIGLRMAMGADGGRVVRRILGQGLRLVALGAAVGAVLSWAVGRWIGSLLFGVSPLDPATLVVAALMLGTVAAVASWLPARRAVRIPPSEALRAE
jgi:putative ABC transport system permease protein